MKQIIQTVSTNIYETGKIFDYMIVNPPFGVSWSSDEEFVKNAPGHIVVADEQRLKELKIQISKIEEQIKNFSS